MRLARGPPDETVDPLSFIAWRARPDRDLALKRIRPRVPCRTVSKNRTKAHGEQLYSLRVAEAVHRLDRARQTSHLVQAENLRRHAAPRRVLPETCRAAVRGHCQRTPSTTITRFRSGISAAAYVDVLASLLRYLRLRGESDERVKPQRVAFIGSQLASCSFEGDRPERHARKTVQESEKRAVATYNTATDPGVAGSRLGRTADRRTAGTECGATPSRFPATAARHAAPCCAKMRK